MGIILDNGTVKQTVKIAVGFKALQSGLISTMSEEDFQKFMGWLQ